MKRAVVSALALLLGMAVPTGDAHSSFRDRHHAPAPPPPPSHYPRDQYARGIDLQLDGQASIYELRVPESVYRGSRQDFLADVRVFNAAGEAVPMGITELGPDPNRHRVYKVAAFALDVPTGAEATAPIVLRRNAAGRIEIVDVVSPSATTERQYILDTSRIERPFDHVRLDWRRPRTNFVRRVVLEASDDLRTWRGLAEGTIAYLRQPRGKVVRHNELRFRAQQAAYLRVRFVDGDTNEVQPDIITGTIDPAAPVEAPRLERMTLVPRPVSGEPGRFEFDLPFGLAMRRLQIVAPVPDTYTSVRLWNRMDEDQAWRKSGATTVYHLRAGNDTIRNRAIGVQGGTRRLWAFAPDRDPEGFAGGIPEVRIHWRPHLLVFVARGQGPFTLAYGSIKPHARHQDARRILRQVGLDRTPRDGSFGLSVALPGEPRNLAGDAAYEPPVLPGEPRQWLLWAVLVGAVLVLLWMAWRLLQDVPRPNGEAGNAEPGNAGPSNGGPSKGGPGIAGAGRAGTNQAGAARDGSVGTKPDA